MSLTFLFHSCTIYMNVLIILIDSFLIYFYLFFIPCLTGFEILISTLPGKDMNMFQIL